MTDPLEVKYAVLKDPGIRDFMIAGERFYPADAVSFSAAVFLLSSTPSIISAITASCQNESKRI